MEDFLRESKKNLNNLSAFGKVQVVLGNEACDLDSAVSSLVYAFFLYKFNKTSDALVLPVFNIPRKDFHLKTEVVHVMKENKIQFDNIVFRNEIDLKGLCKNEKLKLILVDHNYLSKNDLCLSSSVEEIIDHHAKSADNPVINGTAIIEMVGSCATLIADKIFSLDSRMMDEQMAMLLYRAIIIDTVCLDPIANRVTDKDKLIVDKLEQILPKTNRKEIFETLQKYKLDISDLSFEDKLRKDLKVISNGIINIAVASLPVLIDNFVKSAPSMDDFRRFNADYNYHILIMNGIAVNNESNRAVRQIGVYSINDICKQQVADYLLLVADLQLEEINLNIPCVSVFRQGNVNASRKVLLPLLQEFLLEFDAIVDQMHPVIKSRHSEAPPVQRETRLSINEDFNDFDPFESAESSAFTPPNGIMSSASIFLGVGDPLSLPLSSQNSSNQNSCPYTPQNSYADSDFGSDTYAKQLLPSFNSRDMMEKIEIKRGKLRGYEGDATHDTNYPFTPKNSFVDSSFDAFVGNQECPIDSDALLQKLHENKAHLEAPMEEDEEKSKRKDVNGVKNNPDESKSEYQSQRDSERNEDVNSSPDDNSVTSSPEDKIEEKMDISTSGSDRDVNSPVSASIQNTELKTGNTPDNTRSLVDDTSLNALELESDLAINYQTETVDFPASPHHMKLLTNQTKTQFQNASADYETGNEGETLRCTTTSESDDLVLKKERPVSFGKSRKKITVNPDILTASENDDDVRSLSSLSNKSGDILSPGVDDVATPDDIETPDELDDSVLERGSMNRMVSSSDPIPELSAAEEFDEERSWRTCIIAGVQRKIDMKVIEPYKKVLSHGGYCPDSRNAIILFSACNLPDRSRRDYDYVMDNLFLYVLTTLDQLVAEDYILIYLQGATERSSMPSFGWLKRCYQMIDRRLRKNLKGLYLVHPTFWLKTIVLMTKPFISSKFSRKLRFVANLQELGELIPMDHVCIPDKVKQYDEERNALTY